MPTKDNIFACFFKVGFDPNLNEQDFKKMADTFRNYIWGENKLCNNLSSLKHEHYGKDLALILLQFNVKPTLAEIQKLKEIEPYRQTEKSIGVPIIIDDKNFFEHTEEGRSNFLRQSVLEKLELLAVVIKKKNLDTKIDLLKEDVAKIFNRKR